MVEKNRDPTIVALEAVYAALKDLDASQRQKVLSSVATLLDLGRVGSPGSTTSTQETARSPSSGPARPAGLVELVNEKKPRSNTQRIALFAYYREKTEGKSRFARGDLESYFSTAKLPPASNYDRDFVEAVRKGWIHEDDADSYLTTKGIEAIESGFEAERKPTKNRKAKPGKKSKTRVKGAAKKKR
jgi:hypothetical protein